MPELSWAEWDTKAQYRCLHYKYKEQLEWLKDFYPEKIARLQRTLDDILAGHVPALKEDVIFFQEKIGRLTDKFETTLKEIEGRKLGHFKNRPEHGTIYFIDLDGGNDGDTGLDKDHAWLTLAQFTVVLAKNPGDLAKVRANTDEAMGADLNFDEDGDQDGYIEIRGCSIADDPWSDGSDVKPILTFGDGNFNFDAFEDDYWKINRLVIKESADGSGNVSLRTVSNWYFLDCEITDNSQTDSFAVGFRGKVTALFENCIFKDNIRENVHVLITAPGATVKFISCDFDGGAIGTSYGISADGPSWIECIDCNFGQTTAHGVQDVYAANDAVIKLRNCKLDKATVSVGNIGAVIYEEDADGTYGAGKITEYHGTITKDTGVKTGAATFSCKLEPNANCGPNNPLTLNHDSLIEFPFIIRCDASVQKTVTIKIRSIDAWAVYPTNTQLYIEALYLDHAVDASRTAIASTQVLSHASDWVSFTVTFTPLQTGVAYIAVYLNKFEAAKGCYVNMEAT